MSSHGASSKVVSEMHPRLLYVNEFFVHDMVWQCVEGVEGVAIRRARLVLR